MRKKMWSLAIVIALLVSILAGCGGPKADVPIFVMFAENSPFNKNDEMLASLKEKVGASPTVDVSVSPMFSLDKLVVELAAGDNGLFIVPKQQFDLFANQEGYISLDDTFKKEDYPQGVYNGVLYGVPVTNTKWLKDLGYKGPEVMAYIPFRAKDKEKSKQVLKAMMEK
jgi:ABC-type glycerol-3-phosphate transport system substrate-binding protein